MRCCPCGRFYRQVLGFADLRIGSTPDVDPAADLELARRLAAREDQLDFDGLRALKDRLQPEASAALRARHQAHFHSETERARAALGRLGAVGSDAGPAALLDIGCGMGGYLAAARSAGLNSVGVDASLAQLVLARKLLASQGGEALLVAAGAEALPFADEAFDRITAADVLEHVLDPSAVVRQAARVLRPGGGAYLSTPNRFSLTAEPHVGVWGLGFLPRSVAVRLVQRRLGIDYRSIRPLSLARLRSSLAGVFPGSARIEPPRPGPLEIGGFPPVKRAAARVYAALAEAPIARLPLLALAPYFQVFARKA